MRTIYLLIFFLTFNLFFAKIRVISYSEVNVKQNDSIIKRETIETTNSDCTESFVLFNSEINVDYTYNAENSIVTANSYQVMPSNNEIRMKAGNVIVLKPATLIQSGSLFLARIEDCERDVCENVEIQKGISPDNNNINDFLDLSSSCPIKMLKIFNRYGVNVYKKENYINEWYGKDSNDRQLPTATYFYHIQYQSGKEETGWIYLNN